MIVFASPYASAAAGEVVSLAVASGVAAGAVAIAIGGQGTANPPVGIVDVAGTATVNEDGSGAIAFTMPDGLADGLATFTDVDGNAGTLQLATRSQYVTADEYATAGEGVDLSVLEPGELERVLKRASLYAEGYIGYPLRLFPNVAEQHTWKGPSERNRPMTRVYLNRMPIVELDVFRVRVSNTQYADFKPTDIVVNNGQAYIEVLSYAVASFTLIGAVENLGLVANIVEVGYVSGFPFWQYPEGVKEAVTMIATELITYRGIQDKGFGGLSRVRQGQQQYDRRQEPFAIPQPALELLRPFARRYVR